jgi:hypothetical protein
MSERQEPQPTRTEEYVVTGDKLIAEVKKLIHEGAVRRIGIIDATGQTLIEIPMTLGVLGALLLPTWAAIGAIAALVANLKIVVERVEEPPEATADNPAKVKPADEYTSIEESVAQSI